MNLETERDSAEGNKPDRDKVNIGKIPGNVQEIHLIGEPTIRQLFDKIGLDESDLQDCDVQLNGGEASLDDHPEPGDTILAVGRVCGN